MTTETFARRMVCQMVRAARKANHAAILNRSNGYIDDADVQREMARMNIQQAKRSKRQARERGDWGMA